MRSRPISSSESDLEHLSSMSEPGNLSRSERSLLNLRLQRSCSVSNPSAFCEFWSSGKAKLFPARKYARSFGRTTLSWTTTEALTWQWRSCASPSQTMLTTLSTLKLWPVADTDSSHQSNGNRIRQPLRANLDLSPKRCPRSNARWLSENREHQSIGGKLRSWLRVL